MMDPTTLTQFYDNLKSGELDRNSNSLSTINGSIVNPHSVTGDRLAGWRLKACKCRDELKEKCAKHIFLDIYVKVLPLDRDYVDGNMGQCKSDIDCMLANKGMTGVQYLKSCYESTKAPLVEFINRSIDVIGREYMREATEEAKDADENGIELPPQETPEVDDPDVQSQLVDVKNDPEYDTFIEELKKKTIDKIVDDITKIINNTKEDQNMEFNLKNDEESAVQESMNYMQKKLLKDNKEVSPEKKEEMIGLAVREATLFQLDRVFRQKSFNEFATAVRLGRGIVVNESIPFNEIGIPKVKNDETAKDDKDKKLLKDAFEDKVRNTKPVKVNEFNFDEMDD